MIEGKCLHVVSDSNSDSVYLLFCLCTLASFSVARLEAVDVAAAVATRIKADFRGSR
jgi:hypothetical protein